MSVAGVILAGGASRRMGAPKALLSYRGETFVDRLIGLFAPHCAELVVVLGHDAETIRSGVRREAVFVVNPDYEAGQLTSLQCGLRAVSAGACAVLFTPVDYPAVRPDTVAAIVSAFDGSADAVVPRHGGRHGHPVLIARRCVDAFLALGPGATARDVMHSLAARTRYVDVDDPGILRDIDNREDYRELIA